MRLSELQRKNIINLVDGSFEGRIIDVVINEEGKITDLVLEKGKNKMFFINDNNEILIKFEQIKKLGNDVILIENINTWINYFFFIKLRRWMQWKL